MEGINYVEYIGYAASAFVLLSFLMKNISKLRLVNMVGCVLFVTYGFLLSPISWPIIVTNFAIILVNIYYLLNPSKAN